MAYRDIVEGKSVSEVVNQPLVDQHEPSKRIHYWDGAGMGRASWPSSIAAVLLSLGLYVCFATVVSLGLIPAMFSTGIETAMNSALSPQEAQEAMMESLMGADASLLTLAVLFGSVAVMIPCVWLSGRWLQHWRFGDIMSMAGRIRWRLVAYGTASGLIVTLAMAYVDWQLGFVVAQKAPVFNGFSMKWIWALALIAPLVVLQSSAEEIVFRGYLPQSMHHFLPGILRNRILIAGVCSVIFAALHWSNPGVEDYRWHIMTHFVVMSMAISWLTLRLGGIEVACVLHALNNLMLLLLVSGEGLGIGDVAFFIAELNPDFGHRPGDWALQAIQILVTFGLFWIVALWRGSPLSLAKLVD